MWQQSHNFPLYPVPCSSQTSLACCCCVAPWTELLWTILSKEGAQSEPWHCKTPGQGWSLLLTGERWRLRWQLQEKIHFAAFFFTLSSVGERASSTADEVWCFRGAEFGFARSSECLVFPLPSPLISSFQKLMDQTLPCANAASEGQNSFKAGCSCSWSSPPVPGNVDQPEGIIQKPKIWSKPFWRRSGVRGATTPSDSEWLLQAEGKNDFTDGTNIARTGRTLKESKFGITTTPPPNVGPCSGLHAQKEVWKKWRINSLLPIPQLCWLNRQFPLVFGCQLSVSGLVLSRAAAALGCEEEMTQQGTATSTVPASAGQL